MKHSSRRDGRAVRIAGSALARTVKDARVLARFVRRKYGLEPQISLAPASTRSAVCVVTIDYDRRRPGDDRKAARCYRTFAEQLLVRGYALYRLTTQSNDLNPHGEYTCLLSPVAARTF